MIDITEKIKESMKAKDKVALKAWKNLKSQVQKYQTAKNAKPYDEAAQGRILQKYCQTLRDAITQFDGCGRKDLSAEYQEELDILTPFLPKEPELDEVTDTLVDWCDINNYKEVHKTNGEIWNPAIPRKNMGDAIKFLKNEFPTMNGKDISDLVKRYLV